MDTKAFIQKVGLHVKHARERSNLTQQDLADACLISQSSISRLEAGESMVSVDTLWRISRALGVSMDTLMPERRDSEEIPGEQIGFFENWSLEKQSHLAFYLQELKSLLSD